jgi:colicin import membrane protein
MARPGITYAEVEAAISSIIALGDNPTINRVRDKLGTGSPNTILMHLNAWRAAAPVIARKAPELPADLQAALVAELERQAAKARAEPEKQLLQAREEAAELAKSGEALEAMNDELATENKSLAAESQRLGALAEERASELQRLQLELTRERKTVEDVRLQLAQEKNKTELGAEKLALRDTELAEIKTELRETNQAKIDAEKALAVAETKLVASTQQLAEKAAQIERLESQAAKTAEANIAQTREKEAQHQAQIERMQTDFASRIQAREKELMERIQELRERESITSNQNGLPQKPEIKAR